MSKKLILVFMFVVFFSSFHLVFASISINEIMYDLSGSDSLNGKSREWIEVYNSGSNDVPIDASKWRISASDTTKWTMNDGVDFSIPAESYIIFAGDKNTFLTDNPNFSGIVYDTGISSLNNTGGTIKILDQDGNTVDSVTYTSGEGGAGDGNSLQLINGSWVGAAPTPGLPNASTATSPTSSNSVIIGGGLPANNSSNTSVFSNIATSTETGKQAEAPDITTKILGPTVNFVGLPVSLSATTSGYGGEKLYFGKYFWNFGDGDSKEMNLTDTEPFVHQYYYSGDYVVSLDYYQNYYSGDITPDASDKLTIKIIPANISISNVGDEKDFFIELTNGTDYSADISGWILSSAQKSFTFPRDTIISSKQKIVISPKITGFSVIDKSTLKLMTSQGDTIFDYANGTIQTASTVQNNLVTVDKPTDVGRLEPSRRPTSVTSADIIPSPSPDSLTALTVSGNVGKNNSTNKSGKMIILITALVFIGIAAYSVYFIRQKKIVPKESGSDFEILDE